MISGVSGRSLIRQSSVAALVVAETISSFGSTMTALALPWFVLETTGSATRMAIVFAVELAPVAILGIPSGGLIELIGARRTMLIADAVRVPLIGLVPLLHETGHLTFPILLVLVALSGTASVTYFTSQRVVLNSVIEEEAGIIAQANAAIEGATNVTSFAGPALAGVLIAALGAANVLWIDATSFAVSFFLVLVLVRDLRQHVAEGIERLGVWSGMRYLIGDRPVLRISGSSLVYGFLFRVLTAALPVVAFVRFDQNARVAGWLEAAFGAGAVLGSYAAYKVAARLSLMRQLAGAAVGIALPLWLLVPTVPLGVMLFALALTGGAIPIINAPYIALLTTRVPKDVYPHVMQTIVSINQLAGPLGYLVSGPLLTHAGLGPTFAVIAGLATAATTNLILALPSLTRPANLSKATA